MTEPSTAATGPFTGNAKQGATPDPVCKELKDTTDAKRKELGERSTNKRVVGKDATGKGTTVTAMKAITGDGTAQVAAAHNDANALKFCPSGLVEGAGPDVRSGEKTPLCPQSDYKHPPDAQQKSGHAEARLIGALGGARSMTITFSIDWRKGAGRRSNMPCQNCLDMLCAAMKECDFNISLCDKKGQPHALNEEQHCSANGRQKLLKTMGEY